LTFHFSNLWKRYPFILTVTLKCRDPALCRKNRPGMQVTGALPRALIHLVEIRQGHTYEVHVEELMMSRLVALDLDALRQTLTQAYCNATVSNPLRAQPKRFGMVLKCVSPDEMVFAVVRIIPFEASKPVVSAVHLDRGRISNPIGNYFLKRK
jgi:hypothetical protein